MDAVLVPVGLQAKLYEQWPSMDVSGVVTAATCKLAQYLQITMCTGYHTASKCVPGCQAARLPGWHCHSSVMLSLGWEAVCTLCMGYAGLADVVSDNKSSAKCSTSRRGRCQHMKLERIHQAVKDEMVPWTVCPNLHHHMHLQEHRH